MPSHLELALDLVFAIGLCLLGTLILLLDHGGLTFVMILNIKQNVFIGRFDEEKMKLLALGALCVLDSFVFFTDTFYVLSHPKIYWLRK